MPNWCHNRVVISHMEPQPIKELADIFQGNSPFATLIPEPENIHNLVGGVRDWRVNNWGCKCDLYRGVDAMVLSEDKTILQMWFETPWCPPYKIKNHIQNMNDGFEIEWHWDEPGMGSAGYL